MALIPAIRVQYSKDCDVKKYAGATYAFCYSSSRAEDNEELAGDVYLASTTGSQIPRKVLYFPYPYTQNSTYTDFLFFFLVKSVDYNNSILKIDSIEYVNTDESNIDSSTRLFEGWVSNTGDYQQVSVTTSYIVDKNIAYIYRNYVGSRGVRINISDITSLPLVADKGPRYYDPSEMKTVTNTLSHCSSNNSDTLVYENDAYTATITADTHYQFDSNNVSVTMGSTLITPTFAADNKSFVVSIPSIDDNITIIASATESSSYTITNQLSNCTSNNTATRIYQGENYLATLSVNNGYYFKDTDVSVTVAGIAIAPTVTDDSASINIPNVQGNIVISATATQIPPEPTYYQITNTLTSCSNSNNKTRILENTGYSATISASSNYYFEISRVLVTMGTSSILPVFTNDYTSFSISISEVTANITISATATQMPEPAPVEYQGHWEEIDTSRSTYDVVSSSIKQNSDMIELKVSKGDISSQLSLETDKIILETGRLIIESGNFQIDEYGTITATNAHLSGSFTSDVGTSGEVLTIENGVMSLGSVEFKLSSYGDGFEITDGSCGIHSNGGGDMWIGSNNFYIPISADYSCIYDFGLNDMGGDVQNLVQDLYWSGGVAYWDWATVHVPDIMVTNVSRLTVIGDANGPD